MPDYLITLIRTVAQEATVLIPASTPEEATELAKDQAGDLDWQTGTVVEDPWVEKCRKAGA